MTKLIDYHSKLTEEQQKRLERDYHLWVATQPCCVTGSKNVGIPHHIRLLGYHNNLSHKENSLKKQRLCGTGKKPIDLWEIPVTNTIHAEIEHGQKSFETAHRVVLVQLLAMVHQRYMVENEVYLDIEEVEKCS